VFSNLGQHTQSSPVHDRPLATLSAVIVSAHLTSLRADESKLFLSEIDREQVIGATPRDPQRPMALEIIPNVVQSTMSL
jgi:hypothetical protein